MARRSPVQRSRLKDIAQQMGVTTTTVSRALNNKPDVSEETRTQILALAQELGYQPSAAARSLKLHTTETIALVFPDISGPFYSEVIRGVEQEAGQSQYNVLIYGAHGKPSALRFLDSLNGRVDGLILMARSVGDDYVLRLARQRLPFVLLGFQINGMTADALLVDNQAGAYRAVTHLIGHGHRRIALIAGPADSPDSQARLAGYRQGLANHSLPAQEELVAAGNFRRQSGAAAMNGLLALPQPPSAVLTANDEMALGAIEALRARGIRAPEDMAIVGFDDIDLASYISPPLTTVRQPMYELGCIAVQMLLRRLQEPDGQAEVRVLPVEMVIRASCGCAGSDHERG